MYAFDPSERPRVGLRSREWTSLAATEEGVLDEMAVPPRDNHGTGTAADAHIRIPDA